MSWKNRKRQFGLSGYGFLAKELVAPSADNWWEAGGATGAVAVYQPIGADDLADSYVNLANPGTYDAAPGVAPTWSDTDGWTGNGSTQYLDSGVVPASGWSIICRFSDMGGADGYMIGSMNTSTSGRFALTGRRSGAAVWAYGSSLVSDSSVASGVMALAKNKAYLDGVFVGDSVGVWGSSSYEIYIMALHLNGSMSLPVNGKIQAIAIYNTTLSAAQVSEISTAAAAL